eukprot:jgi/Tetstr1/438530/TSEL_027082.t1
MAEGAVGLAEADAAPLADRLSGAAGLVLPGHLLARGVDGGSCTSGPGAPSSPGRAIAYLRALLLRDAGVFLERHGGLLTPEELELFQPLCATSYEVNFYYRLLKQDGERSARSARAGVRNRRLAYYNRHAGSGFFSLEAMRDRDPLLWQHHIGRYRAAPGAGGPRMPEDGSRMSDILLEQHDQLELQMRLRAGAAAEARQAEMVEEETDSDEEEGQGGGGEGVGGRGSSGGGEPSTGGGTFGGMDDLVGADYAPAHASEAARAELQAEFVEDMRARFLDGGDAGAFDYAAVDGDAGLDEDWAAAQERDAQDRYFDESE